jgi:hypothetical protein
MAHQPVKPPNHQIPRNPLGARPSLSIGWATRRRRNIFGPFGRWTVQLRRQITQTKQAVSRPERVGDQHTIDSRNVNKASLNCPN